MIETQSIGESLDPLSVLSSHAASSAEDTHLSEPSVMSAGSSSAPSSRKRPSSDISSAAAAFSASSGSDSSSKVGDQASPPDFTNYKFYQARSPAKLNQIDSSISHSQDTVTETSPSSPAITKSLHSGISEDKLKAICSDHTGLDRLLEIEKAISK